MLKNLKTLYIIIVVQTLIIVALSGVIKVYTVGGNLVVGFNQIEME